MRGIVYFFSKKAPNVANSKALTEKEIPEVTSYTRESYLTVRSFLSCDQIIYGKLVKDIRSIYTMGQNL